MNVGYARVSTSSQNLENQIDQLKEAGCEKIFSEKKSGKNKDDRQQFNIMMDFVREGDILLITKLDRLARSVIDLQNIAKFLEDKDVGLKVLHQNIDTTSPAGRLLFTMLGAIAEFERDLIITPPSNNLNNQAA
jgi:DNA invertase Pin-like site-specific DNA recombinase